MNGEADDDFYDDEGEVQYDTDHKGPVDAGQVDGMVVMAEAMGVVMVAVVVAVAAMIVAVIVVIVAVVGMVIVGMVAMIVCLLHMCIFICNHPWPEQKCRSLCNP